MGYFVLSEQVPRSTHQLQALAEWFGPFSTELTYLANLGMAIFANFVVSAAGTH